MSQNIWGLMMKKAGKKEGSPGMKGLVKNALKGGGAGLAVTLVILFGLSALILTGTLSASLKDVAVLVSVLAGTAVGGVYCASRQGGGVITDGLAASGVYAVLVFLGTLVLRKGGTEGALTVRILIAAVAGGCFGGVLKLNRKKQKRRLKR